MTPGTDLPLAGKTCIITGSTSGIGLAAARAIASQGAHVVVHGRDPRRCETVVQEIRERTENPRVESVLADLSSMAEVRRLASEILTRYPRIDVLVNNAGAYFARRGESSEGIERTFALNVLAPFLLTNLLLDRLIESAPARVVNTSSAAHRGAKINLDDLQGRRRYTGFRAYGRSKLELTLLTYEFARRFEGTGVTANCLHPGFVASRFGWNNGRLYRGAFKVLTRFFGIRSEQGADTLVYLATAPEVASLSGRYFANRQEVRSSAASYDEELARKLWDACAAAVGISPPEREGVPPGQRERGDLRHAARA